VSLAGNSMKAHPARGSADVYLGSREVALQRDDGTLWSHAAADVSDALLHLASEIGRAANEDDKRITKLRIWLSASLCRPVRLPPIGGKLSSNEFRRASEASAIAQSGMSGPCEVWLDAPDSTGRLAVVVDQTVLDALDAMAKDLRTRISSIRPFWAEALRVALVDQPAMEALAVWEGGTLTLLAGAGEAISVARSTTAVQDAESANAAFLRTTIAEGIATDVSLAIGMNLGVVGRAVNDAYPSFASMPFSACIAPLGALP
jgi:hypothetical protein